MKNLLRLQSSKKNRNGNDTLVINGYRYTLNRLKSGETRWICNKRVNGKLCNLNAFTRKINGGIMAKLPAYPHQPYNSE